MKIYKYILATAAAAFALVACDKGSEVAPYEESPEDSTGTKTEVYFLDNTSNVEVSADVTEYAITLGRDDTSASLTVPVEVVYNQGDAFTVPSSVTFEAGSATADLMVDVSKVEAGKETIVEVTVPEDYYYLYKDYTTAGVSRSFKLALTKITWTNIAKGTYTSGYFGAKADVVLQHCEEIPERYRYVEPFDNGSTGIYIEFVLAGEAETDSEGDTYYPITIAPQYTGYTHSTYGPVMIVDVATEQASSGYLQYNYYYPDYFYMVCYVSYRVSAGSFGRPDDVYEGTAL